MIQNYLVVGVFRPNIFGVTHEHITKLVFYKPENGSDYSIDVNTAISQIEKKERIYFVHEGGKSTNLLVVNGKNGKYLRTNGDATTRDNLLSLPRHGD